MPTEDPTAIRLAKRLAADIGCSRAEAEQYIDAGHVLVDGRVESTPGARVRPTQTVTLQTGASAKPSRPVTLVLHKPAGYTLRPNRPGDRLPSALDLLTPANLAKLDTPQPANVLPRHFRHLQFLLPMPIAASGLVVYSQDPRIIRHLTEDANVIEQECLAEVRGQMVEDGIRRLAEGLYVGGQSYPRIKASWQNETHLRLPLKNIGPEYVPNLCEDLGLQLISLRRLRIGRIPLGQLPVGQWRYLQEFERF